MSDVPIIFNGEMQLMNWGESSANGAWVKFIQHFRANSSSPGKLNAA
jgi:hypothetical protein